MARCHTRHLLLLTCSLSFFLSSSLQASLCEGVCFASEAKDLSPLILRVCFASEAKDLSPLILRTDEGLLVRFPERASATRERFVVTTSGNSSQCLSVQHAEWTLIADETETLMVAISEENTLIPLMEPISVEKIPYTDTALTAKGYNLNPHVDKAIWNSLLPYFLPQSHPMKEALDKIFNVKDRVTQSEKSLKKAGFKVLQKGEWSRMIVASHRYLDGYLVKLYTDDEPDAIDWAKCKDRVKGAKSAAVCISKNNWNHLLKVPQKWIYPLPADPSPPHEMKRKNFILLVEDMRLIPDDTNTARWASKEITKEQLKAIYWLLKLEGLRDCVYPFNLPFSVDGRIALIDTEFHHEWPVPFSRLTKFLTGNAQKYWAELLENGGTSQ